MSTINVRRMFFGLVVAAAIPFAVGCGGAQNYTPRSTTLSPGADPKIVATASKDSSQTRLDVTIENLAPPDRLSRDGARYVVWYRSDGGGPWQRVGALAYDAGSRVGKLAETTVPELHFELEVTVESQPAPAAPSTDVVVSQRVAAN